MHFCGLTLSQCPWVSTLAVEWIEISSFIFLPSSYVVSTLAVEWIEIENVFVIDMVDYVSTLAVEWIEIGKRARSTSQQPSLHPRGGVD